MEFAVRVGGAVLGVCRESGRDIVILCLVFTVSVKAVSYTHLTLPTKVNV